VPKQHKELPEPTPVNLAPPHPDYTYFESANENPFRPEATGFDPVNAAWLADAALLAYGLGDLIPRKVGDAGLTGAEVEEFADRGTECFVLHTPEVILGAFRGTQVDHVSNPINHLRQGLDIPPLLFPNLMDTITDARFIPGLDGTHLGFQEALARVWTDVRSFLAGLRAKKERPVWFTGHSLGGALATLAAKAYGREKLQGLYTFGSPRVGNADFASAFDVPCVRFVHGHDLVTQVPPIDLVLRYTHVGEPVMHITTEGTVVENPSLKDPVVRVSLPSLNDHAPIYYASKLWNFLWSEDKVQSPSQ
jgi:hypothetical protein